MATEITMPKLSDTMTEGTLVAWKKGVGEKVEKGDIVAEVETDKAVMELEAFSSGTLLEKRVEEGEKVDVGTVIAVIGEKGEKPSVGGRENTQEKESSEQEKEKAGTMEKSEGEEERAERKGSEEEEEPAGREERPAGKRESPIGRENPTVVKASPAVRRLAREKGMDLEEVEGSGPEGRVLKEDLEQFITSREEKGKAVPPTQKEKEPSRGEEPEEIEKTTSKAPDKALSGELTPMRAAIADAVLRSWQTIPHFTVTLDIDMVAAENVRDCLKETGLHLTITDLLIRAASLALRDHPRLNATFADGRVIVHPEIRMGVAVEVPDGLLIPVIRNCEVLSLREITLMRREVIDRARSGRLKESEISGGTFAISNLGMYGVTEFMALIPPGLAGVLAVGTISDRAAIRNGSVIPSRIMKVTLSADHRVVDGAYGARFLAAFAKYLENPAHLLI